MSNVTELTAGQIFSVDWKVWKKIRPCDEFAIAYLYQALSFPSLMPPSSSELAANRKLRKRVYLNFGDKDISLAQFLEDPALRPPGVAVVAQAATATEGAWAICWDAQGFWHIEGKEVRSGHPVLTYEALVDHSFTELGFGWMNTYSLDLLSPDVRPFIEKARQGTGFDSFEAARARLEEIAASKGIANPQLVLAYALTSVPSDPSPQQCILSGPLQFQVLITDAKDWQQIRDIYQRWTTSPSSPLTLPVNAGPINDNLFDADLFLRPVLWGFDPTLPFTVRLWEKQ